MHRQRINRGNWPLVQKLCNERGWVLIRVSDAHWQITGAIAKPINVYFKSFGEVTLYVSGAVNGKNIKPYLSSLLAICEGREAKVGTKTVGRNSLSGAKRGMWNQGIRECHWCHRALTREAATVDHLIPLSRGGSNRRDNLVLACDDCNQARRNSVLPLVDRK